MSHREINAALHLRDGHRKRCLWCAREQADDEDDRQVHADADASNRTVGGEGDWLCWAEQQGFTCEAEADAPDLIAALRSKLSSEAANANHYQKENASLRAEMACWRSMAEVATRHLEHQKQRADQAVALLREAYGHTTAAHDNLPERIKAALAAEETGPVDK